MAKNKLYNNIIDDNEILRFLSGETDQEESERLIKAIKSDKENLDHFIQIKKMVDATEATEKETEFNTNEAIDNFLKFIEPETQKNTDKIHNPNLSKEKSKIKYLKKYLTWAASAAAFIIFGLFLWSYYQQNKLITFASGNKQVFKYQLPDSSIVDLNEFSSIIHPKKFIGFKREIYFTGEGFFNIKQRENKPFIIYTGDLKIIVIGTSFNIEAYPGNKEIQITVETGEVKIIKKADTKREVNQPVILKEGEIGRYVPAIGEIIKEPNKNANYKAWKTKTIVFKDTKIPGALKILEKEFKVEFIIKDKTIENCMITAKFKDQTIEAILEIFDLTFRIKSYKENGKIILTGAGC